MKVPFIQIIQIISRENICSNSKCEQGMNKTVHAHTFVDHWIPKVYSFKIESLMLLLEFHSKIVGWKHCTVAKIIIMKKLKDRYSYLTMQ